jgi:processive 1,2-diacylglycerol beta-glucosyltransferase
MIRLYRFVGEVSEDDLDFLIDNLEEEWSDDQDYYVNEAMVDALAQKGANAALTDMLKKALGGDEDVEILWVDTEEVYEDEDEA